MKKLTGMAKRKKYPHAIPTKKFDIEKAMKLNKIDLPKVVFTRHGYPVGHIKRGKKSLYVKLAGIDYYITLQLDGTLSSTSESNYDILMR